MTPFVVEIPRAGEGRDGDNKELVKQEADMLQRLRGMPGVVQIESSVICRSTPCIFMQ